MEYNIKQIPEDFRVSELSVIPSITTGKYTYVQLSKKGISTQEAIKLLAADFNVPENYISAAGMKDEEAITTQTLSINKKNIKDKKIKIDSQKWLEIKKIGTGKDVIPKGLLLGNVFNITIRNLSRESINKLKSFFGENQSKKFHIINYFDKQRFGKPGSSYTLHETGKEFVMKKIKTDLSKRDQAFCIASYYSMQWNKKVSEIIKKRHTSRKIFPKKHPCFDCVVPRSQKSVVLPLNQELVDCFYDTQKDKIISKSTFRSIQYEIKFFLLRSSRDDLNVGKHKAEFMFFLPSGAYATNAIHQLLNQI